MKIYKSLTEISSLEEETSLAIGLFDGLHLGHKAVIRTALKQGVNEGLQPAVLTFQTSKDSHPATKRGDKLIASPSLFYKQLRNMGIKTVFHPTFEEVRGLSPESFVDDVLADKLRARFVACGTDFRFGKDAVGTVDTLKKLGAKDKIEVQPLPLVTMNKRIISSTLIRQYIKEGNIEQANEMLGHLYTIDFAVVAGKRIGRTLGTPTINQPYPSNYTVPRFGVYASLTYLDEKVYTSVSSIGVKPTIGPDFSPLSETYIQDYHGDLYGQNVQVGFLKFLRPEIKYDNLEDLRAQIQEDSRQAAALGAAYLEKI